MQRTHSVCVLCLWVYFELYLLIHSLDGSAFLCWNFILSLKGDVFNCQVHLVRVWGEVKDGKEIKGRKGSELLSQFRVHSFHLKSHICR